MIITSVENNKIKELAKLNKKKYRELTGKFLVEGMHLVLEAYKSNCLEEIIILEDVALPIDVPYTIVSSEVIKKLSELDTPSNIIGVCKKNSSNEIIGSKVLILDELQDPGNLGTIIRSAVAFNIDTIVLTENTVDLYNPKVIRATQGMLFHTNIISMDGVECINYLKNNNIVVYGTDVVGGIDVRTLSEKDKESFALVMGNEGNGVRKNIKELCDKNLYIDMNKNVESLNVAIATSILLYELGR